MRYPQMVEGQAFRVRGDRLSNRQQAFLIGVFNLFLGDTRAFNLRSLESIEVHKVEFIRNTH